MKRKFEGSPPSLACSKSSQVGAKRRLSPSLCEARLPSGPRFFYGAIHYRKTRRKPGLKPDTPLLPAWIRGKKGRASQSYVSTAKPIAFFDLEPERSILRAPSYAEALFSIISRACASDASLASPESMRATSSTLSCPSSSKSSVSGKASSVEVFFTI